MSRSGDRFVADTSLANVHYVTANAIAVPEKLSRIEWSELWWCFRNSLVARLSALPNQRQVFAWVCSTPTPQNARVKGVTPACYSEALH
jgi:hypothetical protein